MRQRFVATATSKRDDDDGGNNIRNGNGNGNGGGGGRNKERQQQGQDKQEQEDETSDILSLSDDDSSHYKTKKKKKKDSNKNNKNLGVGNLLLRKITLIDVFITVICLCCIYVMTYYQHNSNNSNDSSSSSSSTSSSTLRPLSTSTRQQQEVLPSSSLNYDTPSSNKFDIIFFNNNEDMTKIQQQQQQQQYHDDDHYSNTIFVVQKPNPLSLVLLQKEYLKFDYGDLTLNFFVEIDSFKRQIMRNPIIDSNETYYERKTVYTDDDFDRFYAFDDDFQKSDAITDHIHKPAHQPDYSHLVNVNNNNVVVNSNSNDNNNEESESDDDNDEEPEVKWCRRTSQHRKNHQSCNLVHEISFVPIDDEERGAKYITDGTYRQIFLIERTLLNNHSEKIIVKDLHFWYNSTLEDKNFEYYEYVRVDATVAEILTSSPYIFDIYGYCGLSILSEYFPHGDIQSVVVPQEEDYDYEHEEKVDEGEAGVEELRRRLDEEEDDDDEEEEEEEEDESKTPSTLRQPWRNPNKISLRNKKSVDIMEDSISNKQDGEIRPPNPNNLTPSEKLSIATQMALGLAELHGCEGGMIIHQDIQLHQFLFTADKSRVKLNDFNRAQFVLYDETRQSYCKYFEGIGHGTWRSPEEYYNWPVNEKVDIFSLGNNFYAILTGKEPYWVGAHRDSYEKNNIKDGILPYIDPAYTLFGSKEEQLLVEIIQLCYEYKPNDRPSIFDIVKWLRRGYI